MVICLNIWCSLSLITWEEYHSYRHAQILGISQVGFSFCSAQTDICNSAHHKEQPCFSRPCFSSLYCNRLVQLSTNLPWWSKMHLVQLPEIGRSQRSVWIEWLWSWRLLRQRRVSLSLPRICVSADKDE